MKCNCNKPIEINYKADFDLIISLLDIKGRLLPFPDYDFTVEITSAGVIPAFVASQRSGVLHNCSDDQGRIHIYADNHGLRPGPLTLEFTAYIPDANFADGTRRLPVVEQLDVHLVPGRGQLPVGFETSLGLPAIKVYPEEWMEEVKKTAEEAAGRLVTFGRVVDDSTPSLAVNREGDMAGGLQPISGGERAPGNVGKIGGGSLGGGTIGGGSLGGSTIIVEGKSPDEYLGDVHYHTGKKRFVELEKDVTPAPIDSDDETGADVASRRVAAGNFADRLPAGWYYTDSTNEMAEPNLISGIGILFSGSGFLQTLTLGTTFEPKGASKVYTLQLKCTTTPDGVMLTNPETLATIGVGEQVKDDGEGETITVEGRELTMSRYYYRIELEEGAELPVQLDLAIEKRYSRFTINSEPLIIAEADLCEGWLFTAMGGRRPDIVSYQWLDAGMPYNVAEEDGNLMPRKEVTYTDEKGLSYIAVDVYKQIASLSGDMVPLGLTGGDMDMDQIGGDMDTTLKTEHSRPLRLIAAVDPSTEERDLESALKNSEAIVSAFQSIYEYSVVVGRLPNYEPVMTESEDGMMQTDEEATAELVRKLLEENFGDINSGELVYDSTTGILWAKHQTGFNPTGEWEQENLYDGRYLLDMKGVLPVNGGGSLSRTYLIRCQEQMYGMQFTKVTAPETMVADSNSEYISMVNTLLTTNKLK